MRKIWNSFVNLFRGNRLWVGVGLGAIGTTALSSSETKPFYYGLLAVIVALRLVGSKLLGRFNRYAVLACIGIFLWSFVSEVWLKKDNSQSQVNSVFATLWNKIKSFFPSAAA